MINDMGWTPESIPNEGHTAMLRCAFRAAIAKFNLHEELAAAEAQRLMADVDDGQQDDTVEAGADFRVNPADTIFEQIVLPDNSADAGVARQGNPAEAGFELIELGDLTPVPTVLASSESEASDADLVLPESSPQFFDLSPRAHPTMDPEEIPDSKRRRPRSILKLLTSPVMRQATSFAADGLFEDFEGAIFKRAGSVLFPSTEMVFMAVLQVGQATLKDWLLSLAEVRLLTTCSKRWAAERPTCLSMLKGPPEEVKDPEDPETRPRPSENIYCSRLSAAQLFRALRRVCFRHSRKHRDPPQPRVQRPTIPPSSW